MPSSTAVLGRVLRQHNFKLSPHDYFRMLTGHLTFGVEGAGHGVHEGDVVLVREFSESEADLGYTGRSCYLFVEDIHPTKKRPDFFFISTRPSREDRVEPVATALVVPAYRHPKGRTTVVARSGTWDNALWSYETTSEEWTEVATANGLGRVTCIRNWGNLLEVLLRKSQVQDGDVLHFWHEHEELPDETLDVVEELEPAAIAWAKAQRGSGGK